MTILKNFSLVVLHLIAELWTGFFHRSSDFYDRHTVTKTKLGYAAFVSLAFIATVGIVLWMAQRVYR